MHFLTLISSNVMLKKVYKLDKSKKTNARKPDANAGVADRQAQTIKVASSGIHEVWNFDTYFKL